LAGVRIPTQPAKKATARPRIMVIRILDVG
jgi:hypothetical protein